MNTKTTLFCHCSRKQLRKLISVKAFIVVLCLWAAGVSAQSVKYSSPIVIKKGGTYRGNWQSLNSNVPAVLIQTNDPVIIENSNIRSAGHLISSDPDANVIVRNSRGYGLKPTKDGVSHGRFVIARRPAKMHIVNNYMENTSGNLIYRFSGSGSSTETIKVLRNKVRNINGKHRNGVKKSIVHFVQLNDVQKAKNVEIAWNEVINEPGKSLTEENINIYNSNGTPNSPIRIHNNLIKGAYPVNPMDDYYPGGGIITDGKARGSEATAYVHAYENVIISTTNHALGIAAGNNNKFYNNRVISSGLYENGKRIPAQNAGVWVRNYHSTPSNTWYNNSVYNNTIGFVSFGSRVRGQLPDRKDFSPHCEKCPNNISLPNPITLETEKKEYRAWQQRCANKNIIVGPNNNRPKDDDEEEEEDKPENPTAIGTGTGTILREYWSNVGGNQVSAIPVNKTPSSTNLLKSFEGPRNIGNAYGTRIRGYVHAPKTGNYTFWIAGDNNCELWLSTDESPSNKKKIAYINGFSGPRNWKQYGSQQSVKVRLEAGKRYYIEALQKERTGSDHLAVGWQLPGGAQERPIPGNRLSPYAGGDAAPAAGSIVREYWKNVSGGQSVSLIPVNKTPSDTERLTLFEGSKDVGDKFGSRIRGYVVAPQTGDYTFWIAGDNNCELWLSTDENPSNKSIIASLNGYTRPRQWGKYRSQKSEKIRLQAGQRYYIEALHKEAGEEDHVAVGWQLPSGAQEQPIPGKRLAPFEGLTTSSSSNQVALSQSAAIEADELGQEDLVLYPNPAEDRVTVEALGAPEGDMTITISDGLGRTLWQEELQVQQGGRAELDLQRIALRPGVYYVRVQAGSFNKVTRLVKR